MGPAAAGNAAGADHLAGNRLAGEADADDEPLVAGIDRRHAFIGGVAAITNVDLDHTDRLGPTVGHIARR